MKMLNVLENIIRIINEVMKKVREVKREMDLDENVAQFRRAENDLQSLLDEISVIIGHSVSEHIKVPTGSPFFDSLSNVEAVVVQVVVVVVLHKK